MAVIILIKKKFSVYLLYTFQVLNILGIILPLKCMVKLILHV